MHINKALACVVIASVIFLSSPRLHALEIETAVGYSQVFPDGNLNYKGVAKLDLQNDLGYDRINVFGGRIKAELPLILPNVYFQAAPMKFDGTSSVGMPFQFGDQKFLANIPFTSNLKLDHYDFALFYNIPLLKTITKGVLDAEVGINLRILDFKGEISQPATGLSQSKKLTIPVPMGYAALLIEPIDSLSVGAELRGIAYAQNRYVDAVGRVKYLLFDFLLLSAGYRFENVKIDQSDIHSDLTFGGPIFELGINF